MATAPSLEASEIRRRGRRRLLGAVTLVLLAVVFIPMILDNEPRPSRTEPSLTIPPKDNAKPLPAPTPAAQAPAASRQAPTAQAPASEAPAAPAKAVEAPSKPEAPAKTEPPPAKVEVATAPQAAKPAPQATSKSGPPPKLEGFAVQVGAFRDESRLQQARAKLQAAGVVHYTERVEVKDGAITRLRAGPFPTREAAEEARARLQKASLDGKVVPLP